MKNILVKPLITEKSMSKTSQNKYIFEVNTSANKIEVLKEIKETYKVDPISVNIINVKGKVRLWHGRAAGKTKDWKKAIITLKKGQKIEGFEIKENK